MITFFPAAGASSRMRGEDKLTREINGEALLLRQVRRAMAAGGPVWVSLPAADHPRAEVLDGLDVRQIIVADAQEGMAASLRALARTVPKGARVMVALPDMPEIDTADFTALRVASDAQPDMILRAASETGTPGHPVIFPADLVPGFATLTGDSGAKPILAQNKPRLRLHPLPGQRALTDLDSPEAWAAWDATRDT
ncbi:nucleotidyltransferase family protein [Pseudoruegeria sp. SHC-113]|nr:nucleotidyltransferase family protein [Pseudoruegeria sp. SHC-113]